MRKALVILAAAGVAASAGATDLNPGAGRAEATGNEGNSPWEIGLRWIWSRGDPCPNIGWVWDDYDNRYWNWYDSPAPEPPFYQETIYMCFEFNKPAGFQTGTLYWRVWGTSGLTTDVWVWNWITQRWDWKTSYTGTFIPTQTFGPVPASWFNADGYLYIMFTCNEDEDDHNMVADRVDIQW